MSTGQTNWESEAGSIFGGGGASAIGGGKPSDDLRYAVLGPLAGLYHHSSNLIPETPLQIEQANIAKQQWADYKKRWQPVITFYKNRADASQGPKREAAAGVADADTRNRFAEAGDHVTKSLRGRGIMAGSDKDIDALTKMSDSEAAARGGGVSSAQDAADAQYLNAMQTIVGIGRGERVQADQALGSLARLSGQEAEQNAQAAAQNAAGLGEAAGIGLGAAGAYGLQPRRAPVQQQPQAQAPVPVTGLQPDYSQQQPGYSQ